MFSHFKRLFSQTLVYGLGSTLTNIISILILPIFTRYLSPQDYGIAAILSVTATLISGLTELGLPSGISRFFRHESLEKQRQLISTAQIAMTVLTIIIAFISVPLSRPLSVLFFRTPDYSYLIILTFITIPLNKIIIAPLMRIRLEDRVAIFTAINTSKAVIMIILNFTLIVFLKRGVNGLFEGPFITALIYAIFIGIYSLKTNGLYFSKSLLYKILPFSIPFALNSVSVWIINWADRFILVKMTNLSEVGLYNLGYSVGMFILLPVGAFVTAWSTFYMSVGKKRNAKEIYSLIFNHYTWIISFIALFIVVFSRDYFSFFIASKFQGAYLVVPVVTFAYMLRGNFTIASVGAYIKKKAKLILLVEFLAMIINVALMFLLIPKMGRMGAAWATLGSYIILPVLMIYFSRKFYNIKYNYFRAFQATILAIIIFLICNLIYVPSIANIFIRFIIVVLYPLILFATGFFKHDEIRRIKLIIKQLKPRRAVLPDQEIEA